MVNIAKCVESVDACLRDFWGRLEYFFCCLVQSGTAPEDFRKWLCNLVKYDAHNIHLCWKGGSCDFHNEILCTCGKCNKDETVSCEGKAYSTKNPLTCSLHVLAYDSEVECNIRASQSIMKLYIKY